MAWMTGAAFGALSGLGPIYPSAATRRTKCSTLSLTDLLSESDLASFMYVACHVNSYVISPEQSGNEEGAYLVSNEERKTTTQIKARRKKRLGNRSDSSSHYSFHTSPAHHVLDVRGETEWAGFGGSDKRLSLSEAY
jgi:hypothetical protein